MSQDRDGYRRTFFAAERAATTAFVQKLKKRPAPRPAQCPGVHYSTQTPRIDEELERWYHPLPTV